MLLSAAVNYPCQSWLVRHYRPWPAHSFTGPPPVRNPLQQRALVTSSPAQPRAGTSCPLPRPGPAHPVWLEEKRTEGAGPGFVRAPPPRRLGKRHEKTPAQWVLGVDDQMMGRSRSSHGMDWVQGL